MNTIPVSSLPVTSQPAWVGVPCVGCGQGLLIPSDTLPPLCSECQHSQADNEVRKLFSELKDLVCGRGIFRHLPAAERAALLLSMGFTPATVAPFMDDAGLIEVLADRRSTEAAIEAASAELVRRMPGLADDETPASLSPLLSYRSTPADAPDPQTRAALETEDEQQHRERTIDREFAQVDTSFDGIFA